MEHKENTAKAKSKLINAFLNKEVTRLQVENLNTGVDKRYNVKALTDMLDDGQAVEVSKKNEKYKILHGDN